MVLVFAFFSNDSNSLFGHLKVLIKTDFMLNLLLLGQKYIIKEEYML